MFDFTPEVQFTEAKNSERRKIRVKRRYIAANDDGFLWEEESNRRLENYGHTIYIVGFDWERYSFGDV